MKEPYFGYSRDLMAWFTEFRSNPTNDATTDNMWCGQKNVDPQLLQEAKVAHPEIMDKILAARRSRYADEMINIDAALLSKAKAGDVKSIQLAWARFENWSPRIEEEQSKKTGGRNKSFAELIAEDGA